MTETTPGSTDGDRHAGERGLIRYLRETYPVEITTIVALSALSSMLQAGLVVAIIQALQWAHADDLALEFMILPLCVLIAMAIAKLMTLRLSARLAEQACTSIRQDLVARVAAADLATYERIGPTPILAGLNGDARSVLHGIRALAILGQSAGLVATCMLAALILAFDLALLILLTMGISVVVYRQLSDAAAERSKHALRAEDRFSEHLDAALRAAKDLRWNRHRAFDFRRSSMGATIRGSGRLRKLSNRYMTPVLVVAITAMPAMFGALAFLAPKYGMGISAMLCLAILMYIWDRIDFISAAMPSVDFADEALARLERLRDAVGTGARTAGSSALDGRALKEFSRVDLVDLTFRYPTTQRNGRGFQIGPLNLTLGAGRIYLIQGGNGAGKSTTLKLLTGLYEAREGRILVDGQDVSRATYRSLFSVVFTDFHLFERLYGLEDADPEAVDALIGQFRIGHATGFADGRFTTRALSTGQCKRLALIVGMIEHRPIVVLDEWTADQDPEFRHYFFTELLPALKARGQTVIAVTHDDRYFDHCDALIRIEAGRIASVREPDRAVARDV